MKTFSIATKSGESFSVKGFQFSETIQRETFNFIVHESTQGFGAVTHLESGKKVCVFQMSEKHITKNDILNGTIALLELVTRVGEAKCRSILASA